MDYFVSAVLYSFTEAVYVSYFESDVLDELFGDCDRFLLDSADDRYRFGLGAERGDWMGLYLYYFSLYRN